MIEDGMEAPDNQPRKPKTPIHGRRSLDPGENKLTLHGGPKSLMHSASFRVEFRGWTFHLNLTLAVCKNFAAWKQQMLGGWTDEVVKINFT